MRQIWQGNYQVTSFLVDLGRQLSLPGLLCLIQEAAWEHAEELGYGYQAAWERGLIWALIRQKMVFHRWPNWRESLQVRTWLRPLNGFLVVRDLEFRQQDLCICQATALYLMLDHHSRRPCPALVQAEDCYSGERGPHDPQRLVAQEGLTTLATFPIRTSDLDMHGHVNNTRIGQWLMDSVAVDTLAQQEIHSYEVDFQAEMLAQQTIAIEAGPAAADHWHFQGRRLQDRKVVFVAQIGSRSHSSRILNSG